MAVPSIHVLSNDGSSGRCAQTPRIVGKGPGPWWEEQPRSREEWRGVSRRLDAPNKLGRCGTRLPALSSNRVACAQQGELDNNQKWAFVMMMIIIIRYAHGYTVLLTPVHLVYFKSLVTDERAASLRLP